MCCALRLHQREQCQDDTECHKPLAQTTLRVECMGFSHGP